MSTPADRKRERDYDRQQAAIERVEERIHAALDRVSVAASLGAFGSGTVAQINHAVNRARSRNDVTIGERDAQELVRMLADIYALELRQLKWEEKGGVVQ